MNEEEKTTKVTDINPETKSESISDGENQDVSATSMALMGKLYRSSELKSLTNTPNLD